jgi:hypothetical protein
VAIAAVLGDAQQYLKAATAKYEEPGGERNSLRLTDTAAALVCHFNGIEGYRFASKLGKGEPCPKWLKYCQDKIPIGPAVQFGRDDLTHYYYAQAMSQLGGEDWNKYRDAMFDHLRASQNKDGSWPAAAVGEGAISTGPVYAAALWCTILQLDKSSHPSVPLEIIEQN